MSDVDDIAIGLAQALQAQSRDNEDKLEKVAKRAGWGYALIAAAVGALMWAFSMGVIYANVATKTDLAAAAVAQTTAMERFTLTAQELSTRITRLETKLDGMTVVMQPVPLSPPKEKK